MNRTPRHMILTALLLLIGSAAMAQNDPQYVITVDGHYLEHVKVGGSWQLQNTDSFNPNCLWYSGNTVDVTGINHNYYFIDFADTSYHFLSAPLAANGTLGLSASFPGVQLLRNIDQVYYFYNWDMDLPGDGGGVARGKQHVGANNSEDCTDCGGSWSDIDQQCWEVYWAEYKSDPVRWELSSTSSYDITGNSGRFRKVTVQEHLTPVANTGLINLKMNGVASTNFEISYNEEKELSSTITFPYNYTAYTSYVFGGATHNYYRETPSGASSDHGTSTPTNTNGSASSVVSYEWTLTGDGAAHVSFDSDELHPSSNEEFPKLYYIRSTSTGHKTATLTLTVTYNDGSKQMLTAMIKVEADCQNPGQEDSPIVTYDNVTVTWYNTADRYKIYLTSVDGVWTADSTYIVEGTNSYTFTGLKDNTTYWYKVAAFCSDSELPGPPVFNFITKSEPDLMIYGSVFGGGRMADVTGNPTVIIVNCDTIGAVFGGNDIAGTVKGTDGSKIILGVDAGDTYASAYNSNAASTKVRVNDVYGGGNGYYIYNGSAFESASADTVDMDDNAVVKDLMGNVVWTNETGGVQSLAMPSIVKTAITVTNDQVKIDSLFGGAKNAFLTYNDWRYNGDSIVIQGGTIFSVFGGNNIGGGQGYGKHYIRVTGTTTNLSESIANTPTTGYGRDFGIRYLFGGGNKVYGSTTDVYIEGGQLDTIFAGGNSADVYAANITVDCSLEAGTGNTFGHTYSNAFDSDTYDGSNIHIKDDYEWDGISGIYNVRTLFGGNNEAAFDINGNNSVPTINLTSGSIGTVYGGGNAGDMLAHKDGTITLDGDSPINMKHSTKVIMNSPNMLVDYLYGGCQVSNVDYSTWVEIQNGHVGYVYGGCNVSGDVGSTRVNPHAPSSPPNEDYQAVQGSTYVKTTGGTVYKNLFAGGNGFYHCNDGINYIDSDIDYGDPEGYYIGLSIPTHNETHAIIGEGSLIKGNVYAGGNLAPVGFTDLTNVGTPFPAFVGLASVRVEEGTVEGDVYGGGNMAAIQGSNEVRVLGGTIGGALYGGNDRLGMMAQISNRILPDEYNTASDGHTSLTALETRTYVGVSGRPNINTVYGGGNGAYDYSGTDQGGDMDYCNPEDQPIQGYTFVDIHIEGSADGPKPAGHINTVYGGGNGVSVTGSITVFINVQNPNNEEHVTTVFGGNNMGDLSLAPEIILLHGNVGTVYGGCNQGAMIGRRNVPIGGATYDNVGSMVHLRKEYVANDSYTITPTAKVLNAVYGGCRMNGVQFDDQEGHTANTNSLVYVEGGTHTASMFGGSDISGNISGTSHVIVNGGTTGNVYGGGNGNYYYEGNKVYDINDHSKLIDTIESGTVSAPVSAVSLVEVMKGNVGTGTGVGQRADVYGGGLGQLTSTSGNVTVTIGTDTASAVTCCPTVYGDIYGGSALGTVNTNNSDTTLVDVLNGAILGNIYGGGLGRKGSVEPAVDPVEAKNFGKVYVNIGKSHTYNCFLDLRECNVFGCNNANGSPQDSVTVNVYQTAHSYTTYPVGVNADNYAADYTGDNPQFSIRQVFGGGNEANYAPENGSNFSTRPTTVNVFTCDNTIGRLFGGGNAAAAHKVASYIYGGRYHQVFGGGNGTNEIPADIGQGGASLNVFAGNILQLFGGNNQNGEINGPMVVNVTNNGLCDENIVEFFGGSNQAVMGSVNPVNLVTTIDCSVDPVEINTVYGGSNLAAITGNVTMNIKGGEYKNVFGGSKGEAETVANIDGNVTLNLLGGTVQQAFGGSNINGNITGKITVNVLDTVASCGLRLDTVYGSGNLTVYTPTDPTIISPELNVLKGTVNKVVFGGGKGTTAVVTSNPKVTIGDETHPAYITKVYGEVFGGGNAAPVNGNTSVICQANHATDTVYRLFGGGNEAGVSGNATVTMNSGKITQGIYGGCNANDTVKGDIYININGGTLGIKGSPMTQGVFGGGYGQNTRATGNVTVTINKPSADTIYADVYGGSALGHVGANDKLAKVDFQSGTIHGALFGGGMGNNTYAAEVTGNAQLDINGNVMDSVYGGCNVNGIVKGDAIVNVTGGKIGLETKLNRGVVYGGGLGLNTKVKGNVAVNVNNPSGNIYGDVYGGSAMGLVNCDETGTEATVGSTTQVTFTAGTIHGNLYGGGHGINNHEADVFGDVTVTVNGGAVNNVFGCNNLKGQPKNEVNVIINELTLNTMSVDSVFGGGNQAHCGGTPKVRILNGTVNHKVFGGGNNIEGDDKGVGGTDVEMEGGTVLRGIYGGCNTDGDVTGDVLVRLIGGTIGASDTRANIHGGGYGQNTNVKGNVTVTFGDLNAIDNVYPMLYGDLYGGSALGTVNDAASDLTTVNLYSGTITGIGDDPEDYGNVFGGGLGSSTVPAIVNGVIHVNIGSETGGQVTLAQCNVYGCNNVKGSPQSDVYLDLYHTAHTEKDEAGYFEADRAYAIYQVFGGGNRAHYVPEGGLDLSSSKRTHVTIHECENTVNYVYGGGNAANAYGVVTIIQGGRFNEVYGGGNGRVEKADIGYGGIGLNVVAGNVSYLFRGSNKNGDNYGPDYEPAAISSCLGGLFVDSYFFGTNEAELYYDLNHTITCAEAGDFEYRYVYAGSRWGIVYGDISLTVFGGTIENLFGGCRGYNEYSADVRKFPTFAELYADYQLPEEQRKYSDALRSHMGFDPGTYDPANPTAGQPSFAGHGGNINLIVNGGTIGKVFGGCDIKGNVEGQINITVNDAESGSCPLFIGEVYGASNQCHYQPLNPNIHSPEVEIIRGTIGGINTDLPVNNISGSAPTDYEGNVFGGGNFGNVTSNPVVIVGDAPTAKVTIKGNVFGGGNEGDVTGGPKVIIVPNTHTLTITAPSTGNIVRVTNTVGVELPASSPVGEGIGLNLTAIPSTNYTFDHWSVTGDATITNLTSASTSFIMGEEDCTIEAVFASATPHTLNFSVDPVAGGTLVVKDAQGNTLSSGASIGEGSVLSLSATPNTSYRFKEWQVNGVANIHPATTTYTMGAANTTIQAVFAAVATHTFTLATPEHGTVVVKDVHGNAVNSGASIGEGAVLSVTAAPDANYALGGWSVIGAGAIDNAVATEISFTMGTDDATLSASFVTTHSFSITAPENGTVKVTNALGYTVTSGASIGEGAVLNLRAAPVAGYAFKEWQLTSENGVIANTNAPITSLIMGTDNAVIKAVFVPAHTLTITSPENGTIKVTNILNQSVTSGASIGVGAILTIVATPAEGHTFTGWEVTSGDGSITETNEPSTTFIMGSGDTTIKANFE